MYRAIAGALAGLTATVPMTIAMEMLRRLFDQHDQDLPPHEVTMRLANEAGVAQHLDQPERYATTTVSHLGYGAAAGALYAAVTPRETPNIAGVAARGAAFGLAVWAGSYLGWLPASGLMNPVREKRPGWHLMIIGAHLVWGTTTALLLETMPGSAHPAADQMTDQAKEARLHTIRRREVEPQAVCPPQARF